MHRLFFASRFTQRHPLDYCMKEQQALGSVNHALMLSTTPTVLGIQAPTFVLPRPRWRAPPWMLHELTLNPCNPIP